MSRLIPTTSLSEVAPLWSKGCDRCQRGLVGFEVEIVHDHQTTADVLLAAFRAGRLTFCECEAGEKLRAGLMKRDGTDDATIQAQARVEGAKRRADRLWRDARVPPKFVDFTFAGYVKAAKGDDGKAAAIAAIFANFRERSDRLGVMLCGPTGMGKTGALSPLFLHYLEEGYGGLWLPYAEMLSSFKDFEGGQTRERMDAAQVIDYLFVDDLGDAQRAGGATDYDRERVFQLVDHRYRYGLSMFVTTNLLREQVAEYFDDRTARRLEELCEVVNVTGKRLGGEA